MKTSFSPGPSTIIYYCIALPITIILGILIIVKAGDLSDFLSDLRNASTFLGFLMLASAIISFYIQYIVPLFLIWLMVFLGRIVRNKEQRHIQKSRDESAATIDKQNQKSGYSRNRSRHSRYILYLRPFSSTAQISIVLRHKIFKYGSPGQPARTGVSIVWGDLETTIAEAIEPYGRLLALGHPGEHIGAGRILTDDSLWKDELMRLAKGASRILILPSLHPGTKWEIDLLFSHPVLLRKTILVIPPHYSKLLENRTLFYEIIEERSKFDFKEPYTKIAEDFQSDAITSLKELRIKLPSDCENGFFLLIGNNRKVLKSIPLWVTYRSLNGILWDWYMSQDVIKMSKAHIRNAIKQLSISNPD